MRRNLGVVVFLGAAMAGLPLAAQTPAPQTPTAKPATAALQAPVIHVTELPARPRPHDARPTAIIAAISPARIKQLDNKLISFGTRVSTSDYHPAVDGQPAAPPQSTDTRGVIPARNWIKSQFDAISQANGGRLQVSIDTFPVAQGSRIPVAQTMANVVAILPGTDPNDKRIFVVSGHYDSIPANFDHDAPGANDDASGTIVSMEAARALAPFKFPATIEFLTVEGEEQGLYGSKHAADAAKAAGQDIAAMLNDDIVGGDQTPGHENRDTVRIFSQGVNPNLTPQELRQIVANSWENDSPSREVARFASEIAHIYLPAFPALLEYRPDRFQRGGDHESFVNDGFAAVRFTELHENSNHQHVALSVTPAGVEMGDRGKWISPTYIANVARINALTLAALASSPQPPEHVYFRGGQSIGTPIDWIPVEGAASYRVLLRPTSSQQWTIRIPAPAVAAPPPPVPPGGEPPATPPTPMYRITIPQSPDNYVIAMVSVDKDGHESLPTLGGAAPRGRGGFSRGGRGGRGAAPAGGGGR